MSDLISRDEAIDIISAYAGRFNGYIGTPNDSEVYAYARGLLLSIERIIKALPSAEPEIIRCGECGYKDDGIDEDGIPFLKCLHGRSYGGTRINDFCSWAERKNDE